MNTFTLQVCGATRTLRLDDVCSFVGEDASGSFGIQAGHARFMTCLSFGLSRFRQGGGAWQYLAMPGAVLYFAGNRLQLSTRKFLVHEDYGQVVEQLNSELLAEEESLRDLRAGLKRLEEEILKRIWAMGHEGMRS